MIILFSKTKKNKPPTFTCVRDDGSRTWQHSSEFFVRHDLIHYAVETTLGYRNAFLGLVAQGRALDAFGTRDGVKDVYTIEEGWAEAIVGLLQWPAISGGPVLSDDELRTLLVKTCTDQGVPVPGMDAEQLTRIRSLAGSLHQRWEDLPEGGTMELTF